MKKIDAIKGIRLADDETPYAVEPAQLFDDDCEMAQGSLILTSHRMIFRTASPYHFEAPWEGIEACQLHPDGLVVDVLGDPQPLRCPLDRSDIQFIEQRLPFEPSISRQRLFGQVRDKRPRRRLSLTVKIPLILLALLFFGSCTKGFLDARSKSIAARANP